MKTLTSSLEGKGDQVVPRWIEPKVCHYVFKILLSYCHVLFWPSVALVNIFHIFCILKTWNLATCRWQRWNFRFTLDIGLFTFSLLCSVDIYLSSVYHVFLSGAYCPLLSNNPITTCWISLYKSFVGWNASSIG